MSELIINDALRTEAEIESFVTEWLDKFLDERTSVEAVVIAKKLKVMSEFMRAKTEERAYAFVNGKKDIQILGAKVTYTNPKPIQTYKFSEDLEHLRDSLNSEIEMLQMEIDQKKKKIELQELDEINDGLAIMISSDMKKGSIVISIPKK